MTKASRLAKPRETRQNHSTVPTPSVEEKVQSTLAWLKRRGSKRNVEGMARYAIRAEKVFGVSVGDLRDLGKRLGRDREFAAALWETGWHEARMLTPFVDEPAKVTPAQMDRWCRDFNNWAICDALCFHLFDKTPYAWRKVEQWSKRRDEFQKRAAFALLASLALHDKAAPDEPFIRSLSLIEQASTDQRNFVKKAVNWALRAIGKRNSQLNGAAIRLSERLAASPQSTPRWVGKDALRELTKRTAYRRAAAG